MILELRHDVMGGFGKTYVEERTMFTDDETIKAALNTLRKDRECAFWIQEFTNSTDYADVTAICCTWDTIIGYNSRILCIRKWYGNGNVSDVEYMEWNKARNYLKNFIKNTCNH